MITYLPLRCPSQHEYQWHRHHLNTWEIGVKAAHPLENREEQVRFLYYTRCTPLAELSYGSIVAAGSLGRLLIVFPYNRDG